MKKISEKILYEGKWLGLKESVFVCNDGSTVKWESIEKRNYKTVLVIIARLVPSDRIVLIKQFRPPIANYIISFPAGITSLDTPEIEAMRELKEETGYTGTRVISISPVLKVNPGIINDSVQVIEIEIDETAEENKNPVQHLESSEEIEVILKNKSEIKDFLIEQSRLGIEIGAGVWYSFCN
ncbi:MAG: NUDIX hydrolase [Candidatus Wallbacteria bacterium]